MTTETKRLLARARDALNEFARAPAAFGGTYCKICCTYEHTPDCIISQLDAALAARDVTIECPSCHGQWHEPPQQYKCWNCGEVTAIAALRAAPPLPTPPAEGGRDE